MMVPLMWLTVLLLSTMLLFLLLFPLCVELFLSLLKEPLLAVVKTGDEQLGRVGGGWCRWLRLVVRLLLQQVELSLTVVPVNVFFVAEACETNLGLSHKETWLGGRLQHGAEQV